MYLLFKFVIVKFVWKNNSLSVKYFLKIWVKTIIRLVFLSVSTIRTVKYCTKLDVFKFLFIFHFGTIHLLQTIFSGKYYIQLGIADVSVMQILMTVYSRSPLRWFYTRRNISGMSRRHRFFCSCTCVKVFFTKTFLKCRFRLKVEIISTFRLRTNVAFFLNQSF